MTHLKLTSLALALAGAAAFSAPSLAATRLSNDKLDGVDAATGLAAPIAGNAVTNATSNVNAAVRGVNTDATGRAKDVSDATAKVKNVSVTTGDVNAANGNVSNNDVDASNLANGNRVRAADGNRILNGNRTANGGRVANGLRTLNGDNVYVLSRANDTSSGNSGSTSSAPMQQSSTPSSGATSANASSSDGTTSGSTASNGGNMQSASAQSSGNGASATHGDSSTRTSGSSSGHARHGGLLNLNGKGLVRTGDASLRNVRLVNVENAGNLNTGAITVNANDNVRNIANGSTVQNVANNNAQGIANGTTIQNAANGTTVSAPIAAATSVVTTVTRLLGK